MKSLIVIVFFISFSLPARVILNNDYPKDVIDDLLTLYIKRFTQDSPKGCNPPSIPFLELEYTPSEKLWKDYNCKDIFQKKYLSSKSWMQARPSSVCYFYTYGQLEKQFRPSPLDTGDSYFTIPLSAQLEKSRSEYSPKLHLYTNMFMQQYERCQIVKTEEIKNAPSKDKKSEDALPELEAPKAETRDAFSLDEQNVILKQSYKDKDLARDYCCVGDKNCKDAFDKIPISFGVVAGTEMYIMPTGFAFADVRKGGPAGVKNFVGKVVINSKQTAVKMRTLLFHELGHACSQINKLFDLTEWPDKKTKANITYNSWYSALSGAGKEDCPNTIDYEHYDELFNRYGASDLSLSCFYRLAEKGMKSPYNERECYKFCPTSYLEEIFANYYALKNTPISEGANYMLSSMCLQTRDTTHSLGAEFLECAILTPTIQNKLEELTGCQK